MVKLCNNGECSKPVLILILTGLAILFSYIISTSKDKIHSDLLNIKLLTFIDTSFTIWTLCHFVLYFILGYYFPNCASIIIVIGIIWEIIEQSLGYVFPKIYVRQSNGEVKSVRWWNGSVFDIFVNTLGFYCGKMIYLSTTSKIKKR
jgi:hypothetical protein